MSIKTALSCRRAVLYLIEVLNSFLEVIILMMNFVISNMALFRIDAEYAQF